MRVTRGFAVAAGMLFPAVALAHTGEPLEPHDLWSAWELDPGVVIPLACRPCFTPGAHAGNAFLLRASMCTSGAGGSRL